MTFDQLIHRTGEWLQEKGPQHHIVISTRIRFARNLREHPFPGWAKKNERVQILDEVKPRVEALEPMNDAFSEVLQDMNALERQVLVERHLISREHAAKGRGSAVVMSPDQSLSIMINEEDHLRMQSIRPGLQLDEAFAALDEVDTTLEEDLDFAFSPTLGYLTACPTNVGTGMRASAMLHLPALVLSDQMNPVIQAVNKIGLAVRGLYGEGTEAMGNLFQISNQTTLGESEQTIINRLTKVVRQVIGHEENARENLIQKQRNTVFDQVGRAYGVLGNAHSITSKEALNLLSLFRLGIDLGFFDASHRLTIDTLLIDTQPAHLQRESNQKLAAEARDAKRATIIRERLAPIGPPDYSKLPEPDLAEEQDPSESSEPENDG